MTILMFVNDEPDIVFLFKRLLEKRGYEVPLTAVSGNEALEVFENSEIKPEIIIIDNYLGDRLGVDIARHILKNDTDVKILLASGDLSVERTTFDSPNISFLTKPFSLKILVKEIEKLLSR